MAKRRNNTTRNGSFDIVSLIISIVAAVLWFFIGEILLGDAKLQGFPRLVYVPAYFAGLAVFQICALLISRAVGKYGKSSEKDNIYTLFTVIAIILVAALGEFCYEQDITIQSQQTGATGYIFVVDDSGSMSWNDPQSVRDDAIMDVMGNLHGNANFCVYLFGNDCKLVQDVIPVSQAADIELPINQGLVGGGTYYDIALNKVLNDLKNGVIDLGAAPMMFFVSDGESSDNVSSILNEYKSLGVQINTIFLEDPSRPSQSNLDMIKYIAEATDGEFNYVSGAASLSVTMSNVISSRGTDKRDLLHNRVTNPIDGVFIAERLVILLIIGFLFFLIKVQQTRGGGDIGIGLIIATVLVVLVGSLAIEVGMNILYLPGMYMRLTMCVAFVLIFTVKGGNTGLKDNYDPWANTGGGREQNRAQQNSGWGGNSGNNGGWGGNSGNNGGWGDNSGSWGGNSGNNGGW